MASKLIGVLDGLPSHASQVIDGAAEQRLWVGEQQAHGASGNDPQHLLLICSHYIVALNLCFCLDTCPFGVIVKRTTILNLKGEEQIRF